MKIRYISIILAGMLLMSCAGTSDNEVSKEAKLRAESADMQARMDKATADRK